MRGSVPRVVRYVGERVGAAAICTVALSLVVLLGIGCAYLLFPVFMWLPGWADLLLVVFLVLFVVFLLNPD